jgi:hypothetical protein
VTQRSVVAQETVELEFTATMEMANAAAEEAEFVNIPQTHRNGQPSKAVLGTSTNLIRNDGR